MISMLLPLLLALAPSGGSETAALTRALDSVKAGNIRADVRFIACDELEGRDTPSQGLKLAARYLRARLERLGFQPAGEDGFFDLYELERGGLDLEASKAWLVVGGQERELAFGKDYTFFGSGEHELDGPIVYVGAGREEDFAGLSLAGKWALAVDGASGGNRQEAWQERARRGERVRAAGALGLLTAPDPSLPAKDLEERDARMARSAGFARQRSLRVPGEERGPQGVSLSLKSALARELLGAGAPKAGTELTARLRDRRKELVTERLTLENVAGLWPGSDPVLSKEVLILSAHYDHEGVQDGQVYNGADDNGSGTTGLLAVAEALANYGPMRRSVLLLWVSGEEKGLLGSAAWTKKPTLAEGYRPVCDINIDMIGRNAPGKLMLTPSKALKEYNGLARLAESLGAEEGFPVLESADEYWQRSDHMNFAENLGIPVAFLFSDVHEDYHKPTDDADKIDCDKIRRVVRLVVRMLDGLQADQLSL
jgi:peptidase M28-like protein